MRHFIVGCLLLLQQGCTIIVGYPFVAKAPEDNTAIQKPLCVKVIKPSLRPIPDIPVIPDTLSKSREATEDILLTNISELRDYVKYVKREYEHAVDVHLKTCP